MNSTSYSIRGTEEFVHPIVYEAVFPEIKVNAGSKAPKTRVPFPFEVEMWSFGVTIYQCATGRETFLSKYFLHILSFRSNSLSTIRRYTK